MKIKETFFKSGPKKMLVEGMGCNPAFKTPSRSSSLLILLQFILKQEMGLLNPFSIFCQRIGKTFLNLKTVK
jgi:hypothetical protein